MGRLISDYEHTSLKPYVEMFEKHVAAVLRDSRMVKKGKCLLNSLVVIVLRSSTKGGEYGFLGVVSFCCMHSCCIPSTTTDDPWYENMMHSTAMTRTNPSKHSPTS